MDNNWKKQNKPSACTSAPWEHLIPKNKRYETMRKIRQECIEQYGYEFDECPKRLICFKKTCIGRPLPWLSPTAVPYLKKLSETHKIKNEELYIQGCEGCPIYDTCNKPCPEVWDFMQKMKIQDVHVSYKENVDNFIISEEPETIKRNEFFLTIPWEVLPEKRSEVVKKYLYQHKDFKKISEELNLNNQSRAKYEFYSALNKLSEYAVMRKFLIENKSKLTDKQKDILNSVYIDNLSLTDTGKSYKISVQAIQQTIKRVVNNNNIKWEIFVKKENNKTIYNIPELFK